MKTAARGQAGGDKPFPGPFSIKDKWALKLLPAAFAAAPFFSAAFYFILPLALPAREAISLILGPLFAGALLFRQKLIHIRRHISEGEFLGFSCRLAGNLWNPFTAPELLLGKPLKDPEEDRLLADLVRMHGPDYGLARRSLSRFEEPALAVALVLVLCLRTDHGLLPVLAPVFGLAALFFLASRVEAAFAYLETRYAGGESAGFMSPAADYRQWNFLSLEAKRLLRGRLVEMELEISRVLMDEAGLGAGARVLEVGAGGGFLWKHIPRELRPGWTGAEKDPHAALYAERHGNGTRFLLSDVKALPFEAGAFDAIVGLECFDSLTTEDLLRFADEALRLLVPGGRLVHLKDFPDWPGLVIAEKFNLFALRALRREIVSGDTLRWLKFGAISGEEAAALRSAAPKEPAVSRPYAKVLSDICSAGTGADPRFRVPMLVSKMILREIFTGAGFEIVSDDSGLVDGQPAVLTSLVARKPLAR